jgi:hypothetical protein
MRDDSPDLDPALTRNAASLEAVRRWRWWVRFWFLFFLLLIPLSWLPLGLVYVAALVGRGNVGRGDADALGLSVCGAMPFCFIGVLGAALTVRRLRRAGRAVAVAEQADRMGLYYAHRPHASLFAFLQMLHMFRDATAFPRANNLVAGLVDGEAVTALDFINIVGTGENRVDYRQTLVACRRAVRDVPDFLLHPKRWRDRLAEMFGGRTVEVPGVPDFNRLFVLRCRHPGAVLDCFTTEVIALLLEAKDWTIEVWAGTLAVQRFKKHLAPAEYPGFIRRVLDLAAALRRAAAEVEPPDARPRPETGVPKAPPPLPPSEGIFPTEPDHE